MSAEVYNNGRRLELGASATSVHWIGDEAFFALGDGSVFSAAREGDTRRIAVHDGAILCAALHPDRQRLVTGGDDGKLSLIAPDGAVAPLAQLRKWVNHLVTSPVSGVIAAAVGKESVILREGRESHRFAYPSTVAGLALDAKGRKLAATHYGGVTIRLALAADDKGQTLAWAGSHLGVTLS
ncbi:MAG TPA: hypothetical protein PLS69_13200, partial [Terricaulis sp.]|nr:hypothetical protein [Terricaulis sp.]